MGRHLVAGREFEPEDEWFRFVRIAIQCRDLRPLREYRRRGGPFEAVRLRDYMLVISNISSTVIITAQRIVANTITETAPPASPTVYRARSAGGLR
jgi:hypothetical protein